MTFPQINTRYSDATSVITYVPNTSSNGSFTDSNQCRTLNSFINQPSLTCAQSIMVFPYFINSYCNNSNPITSYISRDLNSCNGIKRSIEDLNSNSFITSKYNINGHESKKFKLDLTINTEPSKVLHIRNIDHTAQESDISILAIPFGKIQSMVYAKKANQALLELEDVTKAKQMFDYYTRYPPYFGDREMVIQYSKHTGLQLKLQNSNIDAAINVANSMIDKHRNVINEWQSEKKGEKRILRIVIENLKNNTINHLVVLKIFRRYGKVLRIIIFTKNMQCQCLVELDNSTSAHVALLHLNGQHLFNDSCNLKIEFSKITDSLQIQRQNDKCRDYTISPLLEMEQIELDLLDSQTNYFAQTSNQQFPMISNFSLVQPPIQNNLFNNFFGLTLLPNILNNNLPTTSVTVPNCTFMPDCRINPIFQESLVKPSSSNLNECSNVIFVTNLNCDKVHTDSLFILFGVYGDVTRVSISPPFTGTAFVHMSSSDQAEIACRHLNSIPLFGKTISTYLLPNDLVTQDIFSFMLNDDGNIKNFINTPLHRFKKPNSKNHFNIYPPNSILHLSNIPLSFTENDLIQLFQKNGFQCCVLKIFQKNKKMALVKMMSLEEAISALMSLHNCKLSDTSHLRISFSKALL